MYWLILSAAKVSDKDGEKDESKGEADDGRFDVNAHRMWRGWAI